MYQNTVNTFILLVQALGINMLLCFKPEIQMPFSKISGSSTTQISKIGSTLICDEQRSSLEDCATECFERSLTNTGCPGFYKQSSQNNVCNICHVSNYSEIQANTFTTIGTNDELYLLRSVRPDTDIEMDFDNYTETTIYGKGTEGTTMNVVDSDHVVGIKGQGIYLHGGSHVILTGSGSECWTNLDHCSSGFSASIWFQAKEHRSETSHILGTGRNNDRGFNFQMDGGSAELVFLVITSSMQYKVTSLESNLVNQWYHLVGVFDGNNNVQLYIDGTDSDGTKTSPATTATDAAGFGAHVGVRFPEKERHTNGYVDQFKLFYRRLNAAGKWFS